MATSDLKFEVKFGIAELLDGVDSAVTAMVLPTVHQAVKAIASETAYRWKDAVSKAQLWNGEKQAYIESIRWIMTGDFTALVSTDYRHAQAIETGRPAYDMKHMLDTSLKVRTVAGKGKNGGKRYLIIPFRHNTSGNRAHATPMPEDVYKKAGMLDVSKVIRTGTRLSGTGALSMKTRKAITVPKKNYQWGGKLPAGLAGKLKPHHAYDPYAGMVRMKTSAGGASSSAYLTFRVMMEGSPKWIVSAKPGMFIVRKVVSDMSSAAPAVFAQAIMYHK